MLVDSRRAVELSWERWAAERGVHNASLLQLAHGRRTSESLPEIAPHLDLATEVANLEQIESEEVRGLFPVPGARELLGALGSQEWAIVTSGSRKVALTRMRVGGIPTPGVFVTANDVQRGKPAPDSYLSAASRLGVASNNCVVIEDTSVGVAAGKAAGMQVIALLGTEKRDALGDADIIAATLADITVERQVHGGLIITVLREQSR